MNNVITAFPATAETEKQNFLERRNQPIRQALRYSLNAYLSDLNGHSPSKLYEFVLSEVEQPLLEIILDHTGGNLSKAAQVLGLNRGTLRKKLKKYGLD